MIHLPRSGARYENVDTLVSQLLDEFDPKYGIGYMSCSVYDTAWVANVTKTVGGLSQYLFPQSFFAVLDAQLPDGSWNGHFGLQTTSSDTSNYTSKQAAYSLCDGILSTMAALMTLILHRNTPLQISTHRIPAPSLDVRISRAVNSLEDMLAHWHIDLCNAVGFEVLAPALLNLLSAQGYDFDFPGQVRLLKARDKKLAKISLDKLYLACPSALLHSLEALHGTAGLDMSRFKHHLVNGSMMASPAATSCYLMNCSEWDDSAESYLRLVLECSDGKSSGRVPSAWPSTNFEILWVISTFIEFEVWNPQDESNLIKVLEMIEESRSKSNGLVGFAPGIEPDLDDSSKASIICTVAKKGGFSESIVKEFGGTRCLKTYQSERDPSVSANCNALMSLLMDETEFTEKSTIIEKIVLFLWDAWSAASGEIQDKWNLSMYYPMMLISRSLTEFLSKWALSSLHYDLDVLATSTIVPLLNRCITQALHRQNEDGSWGVLGPTEESAYAVLTLINFLSLPLPPHLKDKVARSMQRGRDFLRKERCSTGEFLWIEKITYRSDFLMNAYVQAALVASPKDMLNQQPDKRMRALKKILIEESQRSETVVEVACKESPILERAAVVNKVQG